MTSSLLTAAPQPENSLVAFAVSVLPVALFLVIMFFCFRELAKMMRSKIDEPSVSPQQVKLHHHNAVVRSYFRAVGTFAAQTVGRIDRYSPEHRRFLSSGSVCQGCGGTLLGRNWMPLARCIDANGSAVPLMQARSKGVEFECPACLFRWPVRTKNRRDGEGQPVADRAS